MRVNPNTNLMLGLSMAVTLCAACGADEPKPKEDLGPLPVVVGGHERGARKAAGKPAPASSATSTATKRAAKEIRTVSPGNRDAQATASAKAKATQVAGLELKRAAFAKAVVDREPVDTGVTFSHAETPKIWVFMEWANETDDTVTLDVRWEPIGGGTAAHSVQLSVPQAKRWRTQAFTSTDKKPGKYRCVVRTSDGAVVLSREVEITA